MLDSPSILETGAEWHRPDVADPEAWTERLNASELRELDEALRHARSQSETLLDIGKEDFPLPTLAARLERIDRELIDGRGFVLIRGLPRAKYDNDEMCLLYWGIGMHLGKPWPQNKKGHVLGDVTDQGKRPDDPTSRGNEIGGIPFPYHSDGSDLVGLMCLQTGKEGGTSTVCNAVAIHNDLARTRPELASALYRPQPYDFRGEEPDGGKPWYEMPVFTGWEGRLFVRYIRPYILASQRHASAPRIAPLAEEAMQAVDRMTQDPDYVVYMDFEPGDMQFVNNYHVLHARTGYVDDPATGKVRHLKRLWLETPTLVSRPPYFQNNVSNDWGRKRVISRLDAAG
jgi:hypothetical protein